MENSDDWLFEDLKREIYADDHYLVKTWVL